MLRLRVTMSGDLAAELAGRRMERPEHVS